MDADTLKALQGSIEKWEAIVAGTGEDKGAKNCPLCQMFHPDYVEPETFAESCNGCPVKDRTKQDGCNGSPYMEFCEDATTENAQKELDFLKSLLPA